MGRTELARSGVFAVVAAALPVWEVCTHRPASVASWVLIAAATAATVLLRGHRPLTLLFVVTGVYVVLHLADSATYPYTFVVLAACSAAYWSARTTALAVMIAVACAGVCAGTAATADLVGGAVAGGVLVLVPAVAGRYRRQRWRLAEAGWDRARQDERTRIAAEIHDGLGHELSLVALRAAALQNSSHLDAARAEAGEVRAGVARAAEQLADVVGVLRADEVVDDLDALVRRARASGIAVSAELPERRPEVAPAVSRALHRVTQEALTNAAKHAPDAAVHVALRGEDGDLVLVVECGASSRATGETTGGHGLDVADERVRSVGGVLLATATAQGFRVTARLPAAATAAVDRVPAAHRRSMRRDFVLRGALPVTGLFVVTFGVSVLSSFLHARPSALSEETFDSLRVGTSRPTVLAALPHRQYRPSPTEFVRGPRPPPGSICRYHGTGVPAVRPPVHAYRLCFADGRLVSADLVAYYSESGRG